MGRRWLCLLWAVAMVLAGAGEAEAAQDRGTVQIMPRWCGSPVTGGTVSLRFVGTVADDGYYLTDGLADWSVQEEELKSREWISWISRKDTGKLLTSEIHGEEGAVFTDLERGIYLVEHQEWDPQYQPFEPFFLTVPEGENWDVYRAPKVMGNGESPKTGDHPAPIIGAMGIGLSVACLMVLVDKYNR